MTRHTFPILILSGLLCAIGPTTQAQELYKQSEGPYAVETVETIELERKDSDPLTVRVNFPKRDQETAEDNEKRFPIIIFSHGAGGSKDNYLALTEHWAGHGYVCIQPTHGDSITLLSREQRRENRNLRQYITKALAKYQLERPEDIKLILDNLKGIEKEIPQLKGRMDLDNIGMSGHSFGAHTTQLIGGMSLVSRLPRSRDTYDDKRPKALLMISPQGTGMQIDEQSWDDIKRPAMVITGTNDRGRNGQSHEWRLEVYEHMPPPDKFLVFIEDAKHDFGGISGATYPGRGRNIKEHVDYVKTSSLAFWDAYLKDNDKALKYLRSDTLSDSSDESARIEFKK